MCPLQVLGKFPRVTYYFRANEQLFFLTYNIKLTGMCHQLYFEAKFFASLELQSVVIYRCNSPGNNNNFSSGCSFYCPWTFEPREKRVLPKSEIPAEDFSLLDTISKGTKRWELRSRNENWNRVQDQMTTIAGYLCVGAPEAVPPLWFLLESH